VEALAHYLRGRIEAFGGPIDVRQFRGGQSNPTYYLKTQRGEYVLRRKPPGRLLPSAHAIEREYRVMRSLRGTGVPVPEVLLLCDDPAIIGTPFYLMQYVDGRPMIDPALAGRPASDRRAVYDSMISVLAQLHTVDWRAAGLADFGKPTDYVARQIHRWTVQYRSSETERIDAMERLIDWLPANLPDGDETAIVHGDYRPGNLLVHPTQPRIAAVVDWELSTLGHPLADLAHHVLLFRTDPEELGAFGGKSPPDGIPNEEEHLARYCQLTGRPELPDWDFYVAFAMFRFAAILQGITGRVAAGTANDPAGRIVGARAKSLAERAWRLIE